MLFCGCLNAPQLPYINNSKYCIMHKTAEKTDKLINFIPKGYKNFEQ